MCVCHVCVCVCMCVCVCCVCMCLCLCVCMYECVHVVCVCVCVFTCLCSCECMCVCLWCVCMCACMRVCVHACTCNMWMYNPMCRSKNNLHEPLCCRLYFCPNTAAMQPGQPLQLTNGTRRPGACFMQWSNNTTIAQLPVCTCLENQSQISPHKPGLDRSLLHTYKCVPNEADPEKYHFWHDTRSVTKEASFDTHKICPWAAKLESSSDVEGSRHLCSNPSSENVKLLTYIYSQTATSWHLTI